MLLIGHAVGERTYRVGSSIAGLAGYQVVAGGLILGLIRLHSPAFKSNVAVQVVNVDGLRRTVTPTPENRQVGDRARLWAPPGPA
jgi:hypothetical protein